MSKTQKNKPPKKQTAKNTSNASLLENNPDVLAKVASSEKFLRQNRLLLGGALLLIVLVIAAVFTYRYWMDKQEKEAQEASFAATYFLEADSLQLALDGNDSYPGFKEIAGDYSSTKAGNLAQFYNGIILLKQGNFKASIESLEKFQSNDLLVQARAYSLIGDNHMELKQYDKAATFYQKAADYKPNEHFTPRYLLKLGLALEKQEKYADAIKVYNQIIDKFVKANNEVTEAKKYKAKLEMLAKSK